MGVSTNAEISFGVIFNEGHEFPWSDEKHDGIDEWWLNVSEYKNPFEIFNDEGGYIDGVRPPKEKIAEYFSVRNEWLKKNPIPFELVNYCSNGCEMFIVAIPGSVTTASRGYPVEFDLFTIVSEVPPGNVDKFKTDIKKYLDCDQELKCYLSSFWSD